MSRLQIDLLGKNIWMYIYFFNLVLLFGNENSLLCGSLPTVWKYREIVEIVTNGSKRENVKELCFWP